MLTKNMEPIRYLSQEEMQKIHENASRILEEIGMKIDHIKALFAIIYKRYINPSVLVPMYV